MLEQGLLAGKEHLIQLRQQLDALRRNEQQLLRERGVLQSTVGWLEDAAKHDVASCVLQRLHPLFDDARSTLHMSCPSVAELLQMLPMSTTAAPTIDKYLHKRIMRLTPKAAAAYWSQAVKDLKMLLYLHERDPLASGHDMTVLVNELLRWSCAVYMFNPTVLQELRDVNLTNMQQQPASAEHWRAAWEAARLSDTQLRQIRAVRDFTCSRLQALDAERKQLLEEQVQLDAAAASNARAGRESSIDSATNSDDSNSSSDSGLIERRRWEVAQQLACVGNAWKMLTQLRSQFVVMVLAPVQAARIVCRVYPYMLLGGPLYQHLPRDDSQEAACSGCGNGIAGSCSSSDADSTSSSSGSTKRQQPLQQLQALPPVHINPAWRGVARLPQLQLLLQQLGHQRQRLLGPGLQRLPGCVLPGMLAVRPGLITGLGASLAGVSDLASLMHDQEQQDIAVVCDNFS